MKKHKLFKAFLIFPKLFRESTPLYCLEFSGSACADTVQLKKNNPANFNSCSQQLPTIVFHGFRPLCACSAGNRHSVLLIGLFCYTITLFGHTVSRSLSCVHVLFRLLVHVTYNFPPRKLACLNIFLSPSFLKVGSVSIFHWGVRLGLKTRFWWTQRFL